MAETIKKVTYYATEISDKPGEGARLLEPFGEAGVNMLAISGFPRGRRAQVDLVPEDEEGFRNVVKKQRLKLRKKAAFLVQGDDRPGALAEMMRKLADARINVTAVNALSAGEGRYAAIIWVKPRDVNKAAKVLGAA